MDVLHLGAHVLTGHEIGGVGSALAGTCCLSSHHDAEALVVGSGEPDWVPVRLIRVLVLVQPLGAIPVATEVTSEEPVSTVSLAAKPSARLR